MGAVGEKATPAVGFSPTQARPRRTSQTRPTSSEPQPVGWHLIVAEIAAEPKGLDELATEAQGDVLDGSRR